MSGEHATSYEFHVNALLLCCTLCNSGKPTRQARCCIGSFKSVTISYDTIVVVSFLVILVFSLCIAGSTELTMLILISSFFLTEGLSLSSLE